MTSRPDFPKKTLLFAIIVLAFLFMFSCSKKPERIANLPGITGSSKLEIKLDTIIKPGTKITCVARGNGNTVLIGCLNDSVFRWDGKSLTPVNTGFKGSGNGVYDIHETDPDSLWILYRMCGILIPGYDKAAKHPEKGDKYSAYDMYIDHTIEGTVLIATSNGFCKYGGKNTLMKIRESKDRFTFKGLFPISDSALFITREEDTALIYYLNTDKFDTVIFKNNGARTFCKINDSVAFIGLEHSLIRYDFTRKKILDTVRQDFSTRCIRLDPKQGLWMVTQDSLYYNLNKLISVDLYKDQKNVHTDNFINQLLIKDSRIFLATNVGLKIYSLVSKKPSQKYVLNHRKICKVLDVSSDNLVTLLSDSAILEIDLKNEDMKTRWSSGFQIEKACKSNDTLFYIRNNNFYVKDLTRQSDPMIIYSSAVKPHDIILFEIDLENYVMLGSNKWLCQLNLKNLSIDMDKRICDPLPAHDIYATCMYDDSQTIYLATLHNGILTLDKERDSCFRKNENFKTGSNVMIAGMVTVSSSSPILAWLKYDSDSLYFSDGVSLFTRYEFTKIKNFNDTALVLWNENTLGYYNKYKKRLWIDQDPELKDVTINDIFLKDDLQLIATNQGLLIRDFSGSNKYVAINKQTTVPDIFIYWLFLVIVVVVVILKVYEFKEGGTKPPAKSNEPGKPVFPDDGTKLPDTSTVSGDQEVQANGTKPPGTSTVSGDQNIQANGTKTPDTSTVSGDQNVQANGTKPPGKNSNNKVEDDFSAIDPLKVKPARTAETPDNNIDGTTGKPFNTQNSKDSDTKIEVKDSLLFLKIKLKEHNNNKHLLTIDQFILIIDFLCNSKRFNLAEKEDEYHVYKELQKLIKDISNLERTVNYHNFIKRKNTISHLDETGKKRLLFSNNNAKIIIRIFEYLSYYNIVQEINGFLGTDNK